MQKLFECIQNLSKHLSIIQTFIHYKCYSVMMNIYSQDIVDGFIDLNEHDALHDRVAEITEALLSEISAKKDYKQLSRQIQDSIAKFLYDETRRRPTVMPLIIDV